MGHSKIELPEAISQLACALNTLAQQHCNHPLLHRLGQLESTIMSAISDFAAKQKAHNEKIDAAITGITGDVKTLNDKITALQNTPGPISAEDQALLDELEATGSALADKLAAVDELTPPAVPVNQPST